jgi:hypothetical protein
MRLRVVRIFCGISHLIYGVLTLNHPFYIEEFIRYGFSELRLLVGLGQIFCGAGLLFGTGKFKILLISSFALTIMMAGALGTRININDNLIQSLPSLLYLMLNSYIFIKCLKL